MPFVLHRKFPRALSLIHDMCHQAEVAFDEDIPCLQVPLGSEGEIVLFLLRAQRLGEASCAQLQGIEQTAEHQPYGNGHADHLSIAYSMLVVRFPRNFPSPPPSAPREKGLPFGKPFGENRF